MYLNVLRKLFEENLICPIWECVGSKLLNRNKKNWEIFSGKGKTNADMASYSGSALCKSDSTRVSEILENVKNLHDMLKFFILKAMDKFIHFVVWNKIVWYVCLCWNHKNWNFDRILTKFLYSTEKKRKFGIVCLRS